MKIEVLILSSVYDFSVDLVTLQLHNSDIPYLRLNKESFKDYRFDLNPFKKELKINTQGSETIVDNDLKAIWYRQPIFLRNTPSNTLTLNDQLERSQWSAFLRSLSLIDKPKWMNYPQFTYLSECKPYQLSIAKEIGFKIPETIITNSSSAIKSRFKSDIIIKSLDTILLREGSDCLFTYTSPVDMADLHDEIVSSSPLLAQEQLTNKTDVRVTVVDNNVFAVRILSNGNGIQGDWRIIPKENLYFEDIKLPNEIEALCLKLISDLNLSFGAIDLIEKDNMYYFIEVNPTGEWGWLSNEKRNIAYTIANWLYT